MRTKQKNADNMNARRTNDVGPKENGNTEPVARSVRTPVGG